MGPYRSDWQRHKEAQEGRARAARLRASKPPATEGQCKFIRAIAKRKGWSDDTYLDRLRQCVYAESQRDKVFHPEHLTKEEASAFITKWKD